MTCREVTEFLMDYLDGGMPEALRAAFEGHLAVCSNCRTFLAQYQATIRAAHAALAHDDQVDLAIPEDLTRAILASLR
jgi:anti-sigma factor RsiW